MTIFYMMVGIAGSGKSYVAENIAKETGAVIISSDALRLELFGNENEQSRNNELFNEAYKRVRDLLKKGKSVIFDATNLLKKERIHLLGSLKGCRKVCVCVMTPYEDCLEQNRMRKRKVNDDVIRRMYLTWTPPHKHEGFDEIVPVFNFVNADIDDYNINNFLYGNTYAAEIPHDNFHHSLTIGKHCIEAYEYAVKHFPHDPVLTACILHDCGKPFAKSGPDKNGQCHFYGHENCGSYDAMFYAACHGFSTNDMLDIANLVYFHMRPITAWSESEKAREKDRKLVGEEMYKWICEVSEADTSAH